MKRRLPVIVLGLMVALIAGCIAAERNAEAAARELCRRFPPGSDFREALIVAESQGEHRIVTADSIKAIFVGLPPFSRHICEIRGANGKVLTTRYIHLD